MKKLFDNFDFIDFNCGCPAPKIVKNNDGSAMMKDIENTRKCNLNLAKRYFHHEEYIYLSSLPKEEQDEAFTKIWTLKEAFVKCTGEGIAGGFNKFSVIVDSSTIDKKYKTQYQVKDYHLSLCFES